MSEMSRWEKYIGNLERGRREVQEENEWLKNEIIRLKGNLIKTKDDSVFCHEGPDGNYDVIRDGAEWRIVFQLGIEDEEYRYSDWFSTEFRAIYRIEKWVEMRKKVKGGEIGRVC